MEKILIGGVPFLHFVKSKQRYFIKISSIQSIKERAVNLTALCTNDTEYAIPHDVDAVIEVLNNSLIEPWND